MEKARRKRKEKKMYKKRNWLVLHVKQYKNVCHQKMYLATSCWLMIMMKFLSYVPSNKPTTQQTIKKTNVTQEVVSREVSKLNDALLSKSKVVKCSFLQKKENGFSITLVNSSYRSMDCVIKWLIISSILQEIFSSVSKFLAIMQRTKTIWDEIKRIGRA